MMFLFFLKLFFKKKFRPRKPHNVCVLISCLKKSLHVLQVKKIFKCQISSIRNIHGLERVYGISELMVF